MPTICLVSPGHLGSNPRIVKEADALSKHGYRVHVVYGQTHCRDLQRDNSILGSAPWQAHPVRGFGGTAVHRFRRLRQSCSDVVFSYRPKSLKLAILAQHHLANSLRAAVCRIYADLYIAHYVAALPAVAAASRCHNSSYAFDAEDFHGGEWPEGSPYEHQRRIIRTIESAFLPGCRFVTAASPGIAEAYSNMYNIPTPLVIRNVFPLSHAPLNSSLRGSASPGPSLYWFSQTIGPDRGLECALQAIALSQCKPHLYLRGFIGEDFRQILERLACTYGVEDRLHLLPPGQPDQMERLASIYDLGLVAETGNTYNRRIALTNKLFTYALAGVPALISDIPAHRDYISQAGISARLFKAGDPNSLASEIDFFLIESRHSFHRYRKYAFLLGQSMLNWEVEQKILLDCVHGSLSL